MGEVYLGRLAGAHGFERPIVIKTIRTELVADERAALMFVDEARIAAASTIATSSRSSTSIAFEGGAFLVTEHIDGCDLRTLLEYLRAPPRYDIAITIIAELATGLDAAHDATREDGRRSTSSIAT